jgi:sporulation protein YlmC with PRC-barrel domain
MRTLLLASAAALALAATPALADSLLSGGGLKVGGGAGVAAHVGGNAGDLGTGGVGAQADSHTAVDAGEATNASTAATGAVDSALGAGASTAADADAAANAATGATGAVDGTLAAGASTTADAATELQNNAQSSAQSVFAAGQLIGKTVVDANGQTVGEVSNAVLATDAHAVTQIVISSGGFLGIGTREVAVDAASVDASAASEGTVQLRGLTEADLDAMAEFQADGSVRLLNPS